MDKVWHWCTTCGGTWVKPKEGVLETGPPNPIERGKMPRRKKLTPFESVREFHTTYGLPVVDSPAHPDNDRIKLRRDLISEEYWEYDRAVEKGDLVNIAQELADILYVVYGAALEYGIPLDEVFNEVHRANMSKLDTDGSVLRREDGKVLKGPKYKAPDIESILFKDEVVSVVENEDVQEV